MKRFLLLLLLFFMLNLLSAEDIKSFSVLKVLDGDTIVINIPNIPDVFGKEISVRIKGIDTPEKRTKNPREKELAFKSKARLESLMKGKIELKNVDRDKYFRLLADVYVDGQSVAEILVREGHARPYGGGKKEKW